MDFLRHVYRHSEMVKSRSSVLCETQTRLTYQRTECLFDSGLSMERLKEVPRKRLKYEASQESTKNCLSDITLFSLVLNN